jgi:hypothetical protein
MLSRWLYGSGMLLSGILLGIRVWRQHAPDTDWLLVAWWSFYQQDSGTVVLGGLLLLGLCWLSGLVMRQAIEQGWFAPEESILLDRPLQFWYGLSVGMLMVFAFTAIAYWIQVHLFLRGF